MVDKYRRTQMDADKWQERVVAELSRVLPEGAILWRREDTAPYECDALTAYRQSPLAVVMPDTDAQVQSGTSLPVKHWIEVLEEMTV